MHNDSGPIVTRRTTPRLRMMEGDLAIRFAERDMASRVRDVSFGGFSLETPSPILVGDHHLFHVQVATQPVRFVTARAVYCRQVLGEDRYISGWTADSTDDRQSLVDAIAAVISPAATTL